MTVLCWVKITSSVDHNPMLSPFHYSACVSVFYTESHEKKCETFYSVFLAKILDSVIRRIVRFKELSIPGIVRVWIKMFVSLQVKVRG